MARDVEDVIAALDPDERSKIEDMAAGLIAEEMTLRETRDPRLTPAQNRTGVRTARPDEYRPLESVLNHFDKCP